MKKVLLAGPFTKGDLFEHRFVTSPLGVWRIASFLRKRGHKCEVYDNADPVKTKSFEELITSDNWDIIGFSTQTATEEYDMAMMFKSSRLSPDSLLVAGGSGAALNYQFILDRTPIDIIVLAEGEYPMLDLCEDKRWQDIDGIVFRKRAKVLSKDDYWQISKDLDIEAMHTDKYWERTATYYDAPDYEKINTFRLFTSNYCPRGCKFCTLTNWKNRAAGCRVPIVGLTPEQNVQMVKSVVSVYPDVRQIFFVNDDFFLNRKLGEDFCKLVIEEKSKRLIPAYLSFICLTSIIGINERSVSLMARAGVTVLSIGVESTCQRVLDSLNKKQTVEQIWKATELILKYGIRPYYTILLFTPYAVIEDLLVDLRGFRKLSETGAGLSLEPYLIPLPGTPFWDERIPESTRWITIEGTDVKIRKGFAWLPIDKKTREVFYKFEEIFPKYKAWRFQVDGVKHREKNYQAGVMLDCLEYVFGKYFDIEVDEPKVSNFKEIEKSIEEYVDIKAVDTVGDFVKAVGGM